MVSEMLRDENMTVTERCAKTQHTIRLMSLIQLIVMKEIPRIVFSIVIYIAACVSWENILFCITKIEDVYCVSNKERLHGH